MKKLTLLGIILCLFSIQASAISNTKPSPQEIQKFRKVLAYWADEFSKGTIIETIDDFLQKIDDKELLPNGKYTYFDLRRAVKWMTASDKEWKHFLKAVKNRNGIYYLKEMKKEDLPQEVYTNPRIGKVMLGKNKFGIKPKRLFPRLPLLFGKSGEVHFFIYVLTQDYKGKPTGLPFCFALR